MPFLAFCFYLSHCDQSFSLSYSSSFPFSFVVYPRLSEKSIKKLRKNVKRLHGCVGKKYYRVVFGILVKIYYPDFLSQFEFEAKNSRAVVALL